MSEGARHGSSAGAAVVVAGRRRAFTEALAEIVAERTGASAGLAEGGEPIVGASVVVVDDDGSDAAAALLGSAADAGARVVVLVDDRESRPPTDDDHVVVSTYRSLDELLAVVVDLLEGRRPLSVLSGQAGGPESVLTARELDVIGLVAGGLDNAAVGTELGISPHTVRTHVQNVLSKLGCGSRVEAVAVARRRGLLPAERRATG